MADDNKADEEVLGLDDDMGEQDDTIQLISKEGKRFPVSKKSALMSSFIHTACENDADASEIQLYHIESDIVERVIAYMQYHEKVPAKAIEKPLRTDSMVELVGDWDATFCDVSQDVMFKLLLAANYMDIKPLLMLMCAKVASLLKGKTPEQIRKTFHISDDYTAAEEEAVRKDYKDLLE